MLPDGGSQVAGNSHRHTFQNSHCLLYSRQFPRDLSPDFQLRTPLGLLRCRRGKEQSLLHVQSRERREQRSNQTAVRTRTTTISLHVSRLPMTSPAKARLSFAADGASSTTHFRKTYSSGTCPGIACSVPAPHILDSVQMRSPPAVSGGVLTQGTPVYCGYGPGGDFFAVDPKMRTPYVQNFNLNLQQQLGSKWSCKLDMSGLKERSFSSSWILISQARRKSPLRIWRVFRSGEWGLLSFRIRRSCARRSEFLLSQSGAVFRELHLQRPAG